MIVPKQELGPIARGEVDEVHIQQDPPAPGTIQSVQGAVGKKGTCTVRILDHWPHEDGGHVVRFKLTPKEIPPPYLRPGGGYTDDPAYAMRDEDGSAEWAVPRKWKDPGIEVREDHRRFMLEDQRKRLTVGGQLDLMLAEARQSRMDVRNRVRKIEREIALLEQDLQQRAA